MNEHQTHNQTKKEDNPYAIPIAIVVAGVLIAGAVVFSTGGGSTTSADPNTANSGEALSGSSAIENVRPVTQDDHIRGSIDAPVKIVEYSDLECPFCQRFHGTVQQALDEFGDDVAWVYRHFPLTNIHPKAVRSAVASECAAEQGGNDVFWAYIDRYFVVTPSNNQIDLNELPRIANHVGLDVEAFNSCLTSGNFDDVVSADYQNAIDSGGSGTPYTVVIGPDGERRPLVGAQPYRQLQSIISQLLES